MKKTGLISVAALTALPASAKCGSVDYSWGADALAEAHDFIVTLMLYVLFGQKSTEFNHHLSE
jgi:hypothetical protein